MNSDKKLSIREKVIYINNLISKQNGLLPTDNRAYNYIYDILKYLVYRKLGTRKLTSEIPEEIVQNIIVQVFKRFDYNNLQRKNKDANLMSIFPYLSKCVHAEASKLKTTTYIGNLPRVDESFRGTFFDREELVHYPTFETEAVIKIENKVKNIIKEVQILVDENVINVPNKNLILFPLLVSISRRNLSFFKEYPSSFQTLMRQIYNNTKDPLSRIKFK